MPSRDIRGDLSDILTETPPFNRRFHFQDSYPDAPNPLLRLDGLGYIGLPLCEFAARRIITHCGGSASEGGGGIIPDRPVPRTWELDGSMTHIDSPKWNTFLADIVQEICAHLGLGIWAQQPRCQLRKFFISEPRSSFLPDLESENADGTSTPMIVFLSSPFTGGEVQLSYSGNTITIDSAPTSLSTTSIMSWFKGVNQEFGPVQSGYRVGLLYNLIHPTNTPAPSAPPASAIDSRLRRIFQSWLKNVGKAPEKIVYLLSDNYPDNYPQADLKVEDLSRTDAYTVSLLRSAGGNYGFQFGFGTIECEISGRAEGDDGPTKKRSWSSDDDYDTPELEDLDFAHPDRVKRQVSIKDLIDMEGKRLGATLGLHWTKYQKREEEEGHRECIPFHLIRAIEEDDPDIQEYSGYQGNRPGNLKRVYRRTVLVLWPLAHHAHVLGLNPLQEALKQIMALTSATPSEKETAVFEEVLAIAQKDENPSKSVLRTLCSAATRWDKLDLWLRAFDVCHGSKNARRLDPAAFVSAIEMFSSGIKAICTRIEETLRNECSNSARFNLLDELKPDFSGEKLSGFQQWVSLQRRTFLAAMRPFGAQDIHHVMCAAEQVGELPLIESMVSQVKATASVEDLLAFSKAIDKNPFFFQSEDALATKRRMVADILTEVIDQTDYFAPTPPLRFGLRPRVSPDLAIQHMEECMKTDNTNLIVEVARKLVTMAPLSAENIQSRATLVLIPTLPRLRQLAQSHGMSIGAIPGFRIIYPRAVLLMLENSKTLSEEDVGMIFEAAEMSGELEFIAESVIPKLKLHRIDLPSLARFIRRLGMHQTTSSPEDAGLSTIPTIVEDLLKTLIRRTQKADILAAVELMELSYEVGHPEFCNDILSYLLLDEPRPVVATFVSEVLTGSIEPVMAFMMRHRITPTTSPFAPYFKKVVLGSVNLVLGGRPTAMRAGIVWAPRMTCTCAPCKQVEEFITSSSSPSMQLDRCGYQTVRHVTGEVWKSGALLVGAMECETLRTTSPQSLKITKTVAMKKHLEWKHQRAATIQVLKSISSSELTLQEILGAEEYQKVLEVMEVDYINDVLPTALYAPVPVAMGGPSVPPRSIQVNGASAISFSSGSSLLAPQDRMVPHRPAISPPLRAPSVELGSPPRKKRRTDDA